MMSQSLLMYHLNAASWNHLVALMAAHHLPRNAKQTKAAFVEVLNHHLLHRSTVTSIITQLDATAKEALRHLLAADGALPVHTFEARLGPIRPYRPWRKDAATDMAQPWLAPISATERLWYLGLLYRDPPKPKPGLVQHACLPADLLPLLRELLAQPNATPSVCGLPLPHPGHHGSLDHHLAIWLATINEQAVRPVHKRWLPPTLVALLCTRLGLDQAPGFRPIKSERHHPYLAFLHYLALAADLVTITPASLQLTPRAWTWLAAAAPARMQELAEAWRMAPLALAHPFPFAWEPLTPQARDFLHAQLQQLAPELPIPLADLVARWRLLDSHARLPSPRPDDWRDETTQTDPLAALLAGPLHWLGQVTLFAASLPTTVPDVAVGSPLPPAQVPAASCILPKQPSNTILAPLTVQPLHLVRLARFCDWTIAAAPTAYPHSFTLDPTRIAHLAANGTEPTQVLSQLSAALGQPPSRRLVQRIRQWAQPGQQLRLRSLLVLEADTPERLAQLRRYKLVRKRLGETIAPNRLALNPADAQALVQTLQTLGYTVAPPSEALDTLAASVSDDAPRPAALSPALQWLLITLYQGLGQHTNLPIDLPWQVRQALQSQLTPLQQAAAESSAHTLLDQIQAALNGYLQLPAWTMPPTADPAPVIRTALTQGKDIEIRYWGPADGHITTRRITPYWIEERHQMLYLIGWCHLRQQECTFRLDRIAAVITL